MRREALWRGSAILLLVALTLIGTLLGIAWRRSHPVASAPALKVIFLNVGDGDSTLIQGPEGRTILLDAGNVQAEPVIMSALRRRNIHKIDLLVMMSPEAASIGGIPALLESAIPVIQVWDNSVSDTSEVRRAALEAIRRRHIPSSAANAGDTIHIGEMLFLSALWPPDSGVGARRDPLVCRINYGNTAFVFEGAATAEAEREMVGKVRSSLECSDACTNLVLQTATHAEGSPTPELLRSATPSIAVISCGKNNPPTLAALHRLQAAGTAVWRTDTQGTITILANGRHSPVVMADHIAN